MRFNSTDWSFGLTPYLRNIDITRTNPSGRANNVSFDSQGLSVDLGFYGFERFFIHGRYINYNYSEDVSKLDVSSRPSLFLFFTPAALSFSQRDLPAVVETATEKADFVLIFLVEPTTAGCCAPLMRKWPGQGKGGDV